MAQLKSGKTYSGEGAGDETTVNSMFDKKIQINKIYYVKYEPV